MASILGAFLVTGGYLISSWATSIPFLCVTMGFLPGKSTVKKMEQGIFPFTVHGSKRPSCIICGPGEYLIWYWVTSFKWLQNVFLFRLGFCFTVPISCCDDYQILQKTISSFYSYCPFWDGADISVSTFYKSPDRPLWLDRWVILSFWTINSTGYYVQLSPFDEWK